MGKTLRADIVIGGKADGSFFELGNDLQALGAQINAMSSRLIDFGVESTKTYASYEDAMLDAQVAMRTQYKSTNELQKAMEQLDAAAQKWASDSRFTTQDVAGAISNAAHAGWDLQQIFSGVPAAMDVALAGGMSLSEGLEYLVDISNAAGLEFSDLAGLVDTWTFAANSSSTTVPEMGAAMQKMGATMQFVKGDMAALTTMLAVLADNGAKGTEAGTLLRNSMIRLIAPTKSAAETMEGLAVSGEDLEEIYSGAAHLEEVSAMLEAAGFSAYDSGGELKGFLDIFQELDKATSGMTEQDRNKILSTIFPTRTITGALALLDAAREGWGGLYDTIKTGSDGYAEYAAETMESGLGGSLRHLESVYDAMKTKTGDALSEEVSWGADALSGLIEKVNGMDDGAFNGVVSGLTAVAGIGPGLMLTGGAIKLIGALAGTGPVGWGILGGTALAAGAAALRSWNEAADEAEFGELSLDAELLGGYLDTLGNSFQSTQEKIDKHNQAIRKALDGYQETSTQLSEGLLTSMLTREPLTADKKSVLQNLGDQMLQELLLGIENNYGASEATLLDLGDYMEFRDEGSVAAQIMKLLEAGSDQAVEKAQELGARLKEALNSAFADGIVVEDELAKIREIMDQANALAAEQAEKEMWLEQQALLHDAQTLGLDGLESLYDQAAGMRDQKWANEQRALDELQWDIDKAYRDNYGQTIKGVTYDDAWYQQQTAWLNAQRKSRKNAHDAEYDGFLMDLFGAAMNGSDLAGAYQGLEGLAQRYMSGQQMTLWDLAQFNRQSRFKERNGVDNRLDDLVDQMGGMDAVLSRAEQLRAAGNDAAADQLQSLATMADISDRLFELPINPGELEAAYKTMFEGEHPALTVPAQIEIQQDGTGMEGLDGQTVTVETEADTTGAEGEIDGIEGKDVPITATADVSEAQGAINSIQGKSVTVFVNTVFGSSGGGAGGPGKGATLGGLNGASTGLVPHALGGRSDEAAIFGEAGPEWAIPEQHTQRTAELLTAAAQASGFTWPELLSRNSGDQRAAGGYTLVYSPVIQASDASGVEEKLQADKARFEKWFEAKMKEMQLHDEVEVYA